MTDKERAEQLWKETWWCMKCDCSIEEKEGAFLHSHYDAIVCEDCYQDPNAMTEEEYFKEKYGIEYSEPMSI